VTNFVKTGMNIMPLEAVSSLYFLAPLLAMSLIYILREQHGIEVLYGDKSLKSMKLKGFFF
jgi:hypothetical protein